MSTTVTLSTSTSTTKVNPELRWDASYVKTLNGMIKVAEAVISLIGFICIQMVTYEGFYSSAAGWYSFVSMSSFWITLLLLFAYLFHIIEKLHKIPWLMGEAIFCGLWACFFFIAACVVAGKAYYDAGWGAGAFFGFAGTCVYGFDAFMKYRGWKGGDIAQGEKTTSSSSNTNTSPTGPSYPTY